MIKLPVMLARRAGLRPRLSNHQQKAQACSVCVALRKSQQQHQHHLQQARQSSVLPYGQRIYSSQGGNDAIGIGNHWSYTGKYGVDQWAKYVEACRGTNQSPVDISRSALIKSKKLTPFIFSNFDSTLDISWQLHNNGHTAEVSFPTGDMCISGGGLASEYRMEQFHFHWGSDNSKGSEHHIDGKCFPLEMHLVTYNVNYKTFANALHYPDGLSVFGVLFETDNMDNPAFRYLVDALSKVKQSGTRYKLTPVPLESMLPKDKDPYFRYKGSLTTPPCSEVVTWSLFNNSVPISSEQLAEFRKLDSVDEDGTGCPLPLVDNFRPIQALNGRRIESSF